MRSLIWIRIHFTKKPIGLVDLYVINYECTGGISMTDTQKRIKQRLIVAWGQSDRSIARALGVSHSTVGIVRHEMINSGRFDHLDNEDVAWKSHPYILANSGLLETLNARNLRAIKRLDVLDYMMANPHIKSPAVAQAYLSRESRAKRKDTRVRVDIDDVNIRVADVNVIEQFGWITDGSIDLCICDPPWGKQSAEVCKGIADVASKKLRDGGSLLVLTGSSYLPDVLASLTSNKTLRYHWLLSCPLPQGSPSSVNWLKVQTKVQVVLWLVKGNYDGDIISDYIDRPSSYNSVDKIFHEWGAPDELVAELISRFTDPGDTVADFTLGGGTTAVCSTLLGRRFVGSDIDESAIGISISRVRRLFAYLR